MACHNANTLRAIPTFQPAADHGWLAKVLAGDRVACGLLKLASTLPANEWTPLFDAGSG